MIIHKQQFVYNHIVSTYHGPFIQVLTDVIQYIFQINILTSFWVSVWYQHKQQETTTAILDSIVFKRHYVLMDYRKH